MSNKFELSNFFTDGVLSPIKLGDMSLTASLYVANYLHNDEDFSMVVIKVDKSDNIAAIKVDDTVQYFTISDDLMHLEHIEDIESTLINNILNNIPEDATNAPRAEVFLYKEEEDMSDDIVGTLKVRSSLQLEDIEPKQEINDNYEIVRDVEFENLYLEKELYLDEENSKVMDLLDEASEIDMEISILQDIGQSLLMEAAALSDDDLVEHKIMEDIENDKLWSKYADVEDSSEQFIESKDISNEISREEFDERLNNLLEYMLSTSSLQQKPNYKFDYSSANKPNKEKYEDIFGKFLIDDVDNNTIFKKRDYKIKLIYKGEKTELLTKTPLMDFSVKSIINEIKLYNEIKDDSVLKLFSIEDSNGNIIWINKVTD